MLATKGLGIVVFSRVVAAASAPGITGRSVFGEDAISRMIVWTIHHYQVAPVAMVFGSAHWIVVRGYTATAAPTGSIDTTYSIDGFDVNNPWPPTPMPGPPPPHADPDACGSGGDRGIADQHLTYSTWTSDYMTGVDFGHWNAKFVAVCDPDPPPDRLPSDRRHVRRPRERARLLDANAAAKRADDALAEQGLRERPGWKESLRAAQPGDGILVQRL